MDSDRFIDGNEFVENIAPNLWGDHPRATPRPDDSRPDNDLDLRIKDRLELILKCPEADPARCRQPFPCQGAGEPGTRKLDQWHCLLNFRPLISEADNGALTKYFAIWINSPDVQKILEGHIRRAMTKTVGSAEKATADYKKDGKDISDNCRMKCIRYSRKISERQIEFGDPAFRGYVREIHKTVVIDYYKKKWKDELISGTQSDIEDRQPDIVDLRKIALQKKVRLAIELVLDETEKCVISLHYFEGCSVRKIFELFRDVAKYEKHKTYHELLYNRAMQYRHVRKTKIRAERKLKEVLGEDFD